LVGENHRLLGGQFVGIAGRVVDDIATGRLAIEPFAHIALCTSGPLGDLAGSHRAGIPHRAVEAALVAEADHHATEAGGKIANGLLDEGVELLLIDRVHGLVSCIVLPHGAHCSMARACSGSLSPGCPGRKCETRRDRSDCVTEVEGMAAAPPFHVSLVAVPGSLSSPITGLYELLTSFPVVADFYEGVPAFSPFAVEIVGQARSTITAPSGLPILVQRSIRELERSDIVIVPAMAVETGKQRRHPELAQWMRRMHERGAILCSACTGLAVLAETGLLDGRQATTHWSFAPSMRQAFPDIDLCIDEVLVTAGEREEFVMAGGAASWQDL